MAKREQGRIVIEPPRLDLSSANNAQRKAARDTKQATESIATRAARGARSLASAVGASLVAMPGVAVGVVASEETLRRIHESALRNQGYLRTTTSVRNAFDAMIDGVLSSDVVRTVMGELSTSMLAAGESLRSRDLPRAALVTLGPAIDVAGGVVDLIGGTARLIGHSVVVLAAEIVAVFAEYAHELGSDSFVMTELIPGFAVNIGAMSEEQARAAMEFQRTAASGAEVAESLRRYSAKMQILFDEDLAQVDAAAARALGLRRLGRLFGEGTTPRGGRDEAAAQTRSFLDDVADFLRDWVGGRQIDGVLGAIDSAIMSGVGSIESAFSTVSASLKSMAEAAKITLSEMQPVIAASASVADAYAVVAGQAEQVARASGLGAALLGRAKLITLGIFSSVRAAVEAARSALAFISGNFAAGSAHAIAAAGYATAAGFAFSGAGTSGARRSQPVEFRDTAGSVLGRIGTPERTGNVTVVATSSVFANDEVFVDDVILRTIETGAPASTARVVTVDQQRQRRQDINRADIVLNLLRQRVREQTDLSDPLVAANLGIILAPAGRGAAAGASSAFSAFGAAGAAFAATPFGAAFLAGAAVVSSGEIQRTGRRIGREARRIKRRLGL